MIVPNHVAEEGSQGQEDVLMATVVLELGHNLKAAMNKIVHNVSSTWPDLHITIIMQNTQSGLIVSLIMHKL